MEHDDQKQQNNFTAAGMRLGLLAYVLLVLLIVFIFIAG